MFVAQQFITPFPFSASTGKFKTISSWTHSSTIRLNPLPSTTCFVNINLVYIIKKSGPAYYSSLLPQPTYHPMRFCSIPCCKNILTKFTFINHVFNNHSFTFLPFKLSEMFVILSIFFLWIFHNVEIMFKNRSNKTKNCVSC